MYFQSQCVEVIVLIFSDFLFLQRAGYSIGELFQLACSTNIQQRVLALNTLGNVIQKVCWWSVHCVSHEI